MRDHFKAKKGIIFISPNIEHDFYNKYKIVNGSEFGKSVVRRVGKVERVPKVSMRMFLQNMKKWKIKEVIVILIKGTFSVMKKYLKK